MVKEPKIEVQELPQDDVVEQEEEVKVKEEKKVNFESDLKDKTKDRSSKNV